MNKKDKETLEHLEDQTIELMSKIREAEMLLKDLEKNAEDLLRRLLNSRVNKR